MQCWRIPTVRTFPDYKEDMMECKRYEHNSMYISATFIRIYEFEDMMYSG